MIRVCIVSHSSQQARQVPFWISRPSSPGHGANARAGASAAPQRRQAIVGEFCSLIVTSRGAP